MKCLFYAAAGSLTIMALSGWALAQSAPGGGSGAPQVTISREMAPPSDLAELQAFDQLTAANPDMAAKLARNPALANNGRFLAKYPDLNGFFSKYPGSKDRFLADPGNYIEDLH